LHSQGSFFHLIKPHLNSLFNEMQPRIFIFTHVPNMTPVFIIVITELVVNALQLNQKYSLVQSTETHCKMCLNVLLLLYLMYFNFQIQVRQKACNGGTPSCNCGVAIKENLFYKIYDMCYIAPGKPWWENDVIPRFYTYQLRDFKLSRFYSKIKPLGSTTKIEVM
jgi:hypothetical protein